MRKGLIPDNIYDRSVYRIVHKYNKDLGVTDDPNDRIKGAANENDCTFLYTCGTVTGSLEMPAGDICGSGRILLKAHIAELLLELSAEDAGWPDKIVCELIIPCETDEGVLRQIITELTDAAGAYKLHISVPHVRASESTNAVQMIFSASAAANTAMCGSGAGSDDSSDAAAARDIIMVGYAAACSSAYLADRYPDKLSDRYRQEFTDRMRESRYGFSDIHVLCDTIRKSACVIAAGEGGMYAALWKMGKANRSGLCCDLQQVPILQETVEVCDAFDINPYTTYSGGCIILTAADGRQCVKELADIGAEAALIGSLTDDNDRVIMVRDEKRFLTAPEQDELYKEEHYGNT